MANMADIFQATGAMIQAGTSSVDSVLNLGRVLSDAAQAFYLMKNVGSEMDTMVPKMKAILISAQTIFDEYWSPKKRFEEWKKLAKDTLESAEKLSTDYKELGYIEKIYVPGVMTANIKEIRDKMVQCIEEGKSIEDALLRRAIKRVVNFRNLIDITNVETLNKAMRSILVKLEGERSVLNLFGEFGTGKRVILEHLNNDQTIRNKYDIVIWASASYIETPDKNSNIEAGIQRIIAERLGLDIQGNNDVNTVAEKIHAELKGVKYLLLLDDVKDIFDVNAIGLPRNDNGSKIVITTINPFVFEGEKPIFVKSGRLVGGESWQMFRNLLKKDNLLIDHDIRKIAKKVVTWCDHHFLLIKIAAENFKSEDTAESWVSCFNMLKSAPRKGDGYMKAMEKILHLGYKTLTEEQKLCFLFCALYPKENGSFGGKIPIHCLFDCWAALKFLVYGHKVEDLSPSGYRILESLIKKSLLNKDPNKQYVIMSKLFRGVAVHYLEQDGQLTKGYVAIEKLEEQKLDGCTAIQWLSLANCNIKVLPTKKRFGKVTALFLQKNSELENIPTGFIDHMNELQVLDLHKTGIKSIFSVRNLRSLKVLYVNSCNLLQSFSVGKEGLDELEVLDIRGTAIKQIPDDIKKLKKLRRLMISISGCNLDLLYISGILQLKELIVDVQSDSANHNTEVTRIIKSIHNLDELCTLQFHFQDVVVPVIKVLGTFSKISVPNLESLVHLLEGKAFLEHENLEVLIGLAPNVEISTLIHVKNSFIRPSDKNGKKYETGTIYSNVQTLIMIQNDNICDMSTSTSNMNDIHSCLVYECNKVETLMQTAGFSSLKILVLSKCSALKVLFSNNTPLEMGIEHLEIRDCPAIEDIDIVGGVEFPSLMTLVLYNLPELKLEKSLMNWPLLKTSRMHRCGNMTKLPFKVDGPTKLRLIEVEQTWWDEKLRLSDLRFEGH